MGIEVAVGAARGPALGVDGLSAVAGLALLTAGAFAGAAGLLTDFETAEALLAAGAAGFAAAVFLTAVFGAGVALATGFFTMTGSFDELERAFNG
jgi:hypothetical protein